MQVKKAALFACWKSTEVVDLEVVAGVGFEPTAFRL